MTNEHDDGIFCGGCGASMSLEAGHDSADLDGRFRCDECRAEDAADAAAACEAEETPPPPADLRATTRIPVMSMREMVFGGAS